MSFFDFEDVERIGNNPKIVFIDTDGMGNRSSGEELLVTNHLKSSNSTTITGPSTKIIHFKGSGAGQSIVSVFTYSINKARLLGTSNFQCPYKASKSEY